MALLIGFILVALLGALHHVCLRGLDWLTGADGRNPNRTILMTFIGLLTIHTLEIVLFAGAYAALLSWPYMGELAGGRAESWSGLIYFSGINFATLGYTQIEAEGPVRMINMMQSLGGFMVLTWSATFIYSAWEEAFRS
ncbi:ion channel [Tranquillimonas alkanivorans]|uniref:Ion channel n=1 Tax=Tranquillimonas alkanivorans TaxID=441119 RepID=A0A1I5WRD9_9RHOB|nr:ion channel [Tranquillimonas alkanivorans]SFQ22260.1 Ion channel [Tranquillimonas alkanivorans]